MPTTSNHEHSFPARYKKIESQKKRQPLPQTAHYFNKNAEIADRSSWATTSQVLCSRKMENNYLPQIHFKYNFSDLDIKSETAENPSA